MASHIEVAQAYVTIIPSLKGSQKTIAKELTPAAASAAKDAGDKIDKGLSDAGKSGAQKAAKALSEGIGKRSTSAIDSMARKTATTIGASATVAAGLVSDRFKAAGTRIQNYLSNALQPNELGQKIGGVAQRVGEAMSGVVGRVKGVGLAIGDFAKQAAGKVGGVFANIKEKISGPLGAAASVAGKAFSGIGKVAGSVFSGIASAARSAFGALGTAAKAGAAAATAALVIVGKGALNAYADYEQLSGGVKKLFGEDVAQTVAANAQAAYQTAGMSANQYMETVTSFSASLIAGLGGDTAQAASYADKAVRDMADNVNTFGSSMQSVQDAYRGFAKQNYTMLDNLNLGYGGTASAMARLIRDSGVLGDAAADLTAENLNEKVSFDQIVEAIHVTQERMGIYGTTSREAANTISGSINSMKAAWENWLTGLGDDSANIEELTDQLVDSAVRAAENVVPRLGVIVGRVVAAAPGAIQRIGSALSEQIVPMLDSLTNGAVSKITDAVGPAASRISSTVGNIADGLAPLSDKAAVVAEKVGDLLVGAINNAAGGFEKLAPVIVDLADGALTVMPGILDRVSSGFEIAHGFIERVGDVVASLFSRLSPLAPVIADIADKFGGLLAQALDVVASIFEWLEPIIASLAENLLPLLSGAIDIVSEAFDAVCKFVKPVADILGPVLADTVIPAVCDALGFLGDIVGGIVDVFSWFGDVVGGAIDFITGKNDDLRSSAESAMSKTVGSYSDTAKGINVNMTKAGKSVTSYNKIDLKNKNATATVNDKSLLTAQTHKQTWNATNINNKSATGSISGNLASAVANKNDWNRTGLNSVWGRATIDATVNAVVRDFSSHVSGSGGNYTMASGGTIAHHASGFIAPRATVTSIGNHVGLIGEAGAEAVVGSRSATHVIPLTNKRYSRPFIDDIADGLSQRDTSSAAILQELQALRTEVGRLKVYINGRTLVGEIAPDMDAALRRRGQLVGGIG